MKKIYLKVIVSAARTNIRFDGAIIAKVKLFVLSMMQRRYRTIYCADSVDTLYMYHRLLYTYTFHILICIIRYNSEAGNRLDCMAV